MSRLKLLIPLSIVMLVIGCSTQPTPIAEDIQHQEDAKAEMIGMSEGEAFTCLGTPEKKSAEGKIELWSYAFGTCIVDLTMAGDNKVKSVNYSTRPDPKAKPADEPLTQEEQCARVPIVTSCLRWLRH